MRQIRVSCQGNKETVDSDSYQSNLAVGRERVRGTRSTTPDAVWPAAAVAIQFWTEGEQSC